MLAIWTKTSSDEPHFRLLDHLLTTVQGWALDRKPPALALIFDLAESLRNRADSDGLERFGDRLIIWLQNDGPNTRELNLLFLRLAHQIYTFADNLGTDSRSGPLAAKIASVETLLIKFELEDLSGDDSKPLEANLASTSETVAMACLAASMAGAPPIPAHEEGTWRLTKLRELLSLAHAAQHYNIHFALALCGWLHERTSTDDPFAPDLNELELTCLERASKLEARMGLLRASLNSAERAAYDSAYKYYRPDDAQRLANQAILHGEHIFARINAQKNDSSTEAQTALLDRLYKISRLTRDPKKIFDQLNRICEVLRGVARTHERAEQWREAINTYSHLGYRYFNAAEYTGIRRLYLLAVYFFEKSEVIRARVPGGGYEEIDTSAPNAPKLGYRRLEADGFIFGASAKLAQDAAAVELFEYAARAHLEAGDMVFGQLGLSYFYKSAACYFEAQANLVRAAGSTNLWSTLALLKEAAAQFHRCFPQYEHVFRCYQYILLNLVRGAETPCSDDLVRELTRVLHPEGRRIQQTAIAISTAFKAGHAPTAQRGISELAKLFIFLNPLG